MIVRPHLTAFLAGTIAALVVDACMQLALDALRVPSSGTGAPWWITANLVGRGRWVVFAALLWWLAPRLEEITPNRTEAVARATPEEAWRQVAVALVAVPVLWIIATWSVSAVRFTFLGTWTTDGRVFLSPDYYRGLSMDLAPWALAAAAVMAARRHI